MDKRKLEKLKPMKATACMMRAKLEDIPKERHADGKNVWVHKWYKFFDAAVENEILKVGIWQRCYLYAVGQQPDYTIYIDKNGKWLTDGIEGWQKAKIINLDFKTQKGEIFGSWNWSTGKALKTVTEYLGIQAATIPEAIRKHQTKDNTLNGKYHRNELAAIDEFMESVPEVPKGFNNSWLVKTAFKDITSLMYHPGKNVKEAYCTRCQTIVQIKDKPKHLKKTVCPNCKAEATYRSWNKQRQFGSRKYVGVMQRTKGSEKYCLTQYEIKLTYKKENDYREPEIRRGYVERFEFMPGFTWTSSYEMAEYKKTRVNRWCYARTHGMGNSWHRAQPRCVLYEKNIDSLFKETDLKYVSLRKVVEGRKIAPQEGLAILDIYSGVFEKLIKVKMWNLVLEMTEDVYDVESCVYKEGRKLNEILKLDRQRAKMAVNMNCTLEELEVLQAAQKMRVTVDEELVREVVKHVGGRWHDDICLFLTMPNLRKTLGYLKKIEQQFNVGPKSALRDYEDYLQQLHKLRIPRDKHNRFPANFYHVHEELTKQIEEKENMIEKASVKKKNLILQKLVKEIKGDYEANSNKYMIVWPETKADFTKEGQLQHNCVGGYFERCVKNETTVFFLRRKEEPEKPFCTVEFNDGKMKQCRTKYNHDAPADVIEYMGKIEENYRKKQKLLSRG